ncbi:MAG: hypothetical protein NTZ09_00675, partial [Candidatus Hydrogenedentes bacterium]|nr:hypothetical protein [Candidatus Hydrogenedentota bacterium]
MKGRPYFSFNFDQLQAVFNDNRGNVQVLRQLLDELGNRRTPKAVRLKEAVTAVIAQAETAPQRQSPQSPGRH